MAQKSIINIFLLVVTLLTGYGFYLSSQTEQPQSSARAKLGGDFTLSSINGSKSLSDFQSGPVLLYFGFTSCPDICPNSLSVIRHSLEQLIAEQLSKVNAIFVSVDPDRDSFQDLAKYSQFFSPKIVGMTGTREQIDTVIKQYGAYYRFVDLENLAM